MRRRSGAPSRVISLVIATSRPEQALAADTDDLPRDGSSPGLGEPCDGLGDVLRVTTLLQRVHPAPDLPRGERDPCCHLGLDETGGDGVDRDVTVRDLARECRDQTDDTGLARAVVGLATVSGDPGDRSDTDDAATVGQAAVTEDRLVHAKDRTEVHLHDP